MFKHHREFFTHPDFPGWVMYDFDWGESHPKTQAPITLNGVLVGYQHDETRNDNIYVTSVTKHPEALRKVEEFYHAVKTKFAEERKASIEKWEKEIKYDAWRKANEAEKVLGVGKCQDMKHVMSSKADAHHSPDPIQVMLDWPSWMQVTALILFCAACYSVACGLNDLTIWMGGV